VSDTAIATKVTSVAVACAPTANCTGTPTSITATVAETPDSAGGAFNFSLTGAFRKPLAVGAALPLSISGPASLPPWTVNRPYSTTIVGAGGDGNYIWSASGLPTGLAINAGTGVINGTPTSAGAPTATITLNDVSGDTAATRQYVVTINAAPSITTASPLPGGEVSLTYTNTTLTGSGGTTAYSWSATGLPAGLVINSAGVISGTPTAAGTFTVAATLTDAAGATATANLSLTVVAAPAISSVTLANTGGVGGAGKIEKGDTITVVFSAQMSVSSFCSTWSGNTTDQSLVANNDVTVSVADGTGATNDTLTVTSATCTFRFGSINLGSNGYVSTAASFGGINSNTSTITWTASTRTLVITLGNKISGTVAAVTSSMPVYTPGAITDSAGAAISNSPFTLTTAKQF
jgi:hypothetical protein